MIKTRKYLYILMTSFLITQTNIQCSEKSETNKNKTVFSSSTEQCIQEIIKLRKENEDLRETIRLMNLLQELPENERTKLEIIYFQKPYDFSPPLNIN